MFEQEVERDFSFVSWIAQLVIVYLFPVITLSLFSHWLTFRNLILDQIISFLFIGTVGYGLAQPASAMAWGPAKEGRWIWVLPVSIEIAVGASALLSEGFLATWHGLFFVPGPGQGEGSWAIVLLTLPTWGCCCYSATMREHRSDGNEAGDRPSHL